MFAILPSLAMALASEFIDNQAVLKWVGFAGEIINKGIQVDERLQALDDHIKQMVAEGRNPTQDEWDVLQARSDVAHQKIQSWRLPDNA